MDSVDCDSVRKFHLMNSSKLTVLVALISAPRCHSFRRCPSRDGTEPAQSNPRESDAGRKSDAGGPANQTPAKPAEPAPCPARRSTSAPASSDGPGEAALDGHPDADVSGAWGETRRQGARGVSAQAGPGSRRRSRRADVDRARHAASARRRSACRRRCAGQRIGSAQRRRAAGGEPSSHPRGAEQADAGWLPDPQRVRHLDSRNRQLAAELPEGERRSTSPTRSICRCCTRSG